ncbi:hypothetical protein [Micromonospora wenchangensis]|uniref:hypothetical protein n=1 Tax=Micromonospora wenchangensis TaxID=1185415 RepID=UPI00380B97BB
MTPNFEVFHRPTPGIDSTPTVTISPAAMILNKAATELLGRPDRVELLYDRVRRVVGVRPAMEGRGTSFKATPTASGGFRVAHRSFVNHYGVQCAPARRWPAWLDGGVLCADLAGDCTLIARNGMPVSRG